MREQLVKRNKGLDFFNCSAVLFLLIWVWKYIELAYTSDPSNSDGFILLFITLAATILLIIRSVQHNNKVNVLIFIFISLYVYELIYYFILGYSIAFHSFFKDYGYYYKTLTILSLFLIFLLLSNVDAYKTTIIRTEFNPLLFWLNFIIAFFIMLYGKTGYKQMSPINEYFIVFFLVSFIFSKQTIGYRLLLFSLAGVYGLKNVLLGGRIEMLQLGILMFALFFKDRISIKQLFLLVIVGTISLSAYEGIRSSLKTDKAEVSDSKTMKLDGESNRISNQGDVFYASVRIVGMIEDDLLTAQERFESFCYFLISPIMKGKDLPAVQDLSSYKKSEFSTGGGGLLPVFLYAWLYFPGVIIIALFIAYILRNLMNAQYAFFYCYSLLIVSTVPRWFAYYPTNIIKLCLLGALYIQICHIIHHRMLLRPIVYQEQ
jgi:hypothetical protein